MPPQALHHPTAQISPNAEIGANVRIGAFSIIEDGAVIGEGTEIRSSVVIYGSARIGAGCTIHHSAVIGGEPQDLKFNGETTHAIIGDRTVIREFVTVNRGTEASGETRIGNDCLIMAYCHAAHDCVIGNNVIIANASQLGGHVEIDDYAIIGGVAKVHQFSKVGKHAMVGAGTKIVKDIPPFALADGIPGRFEAVNKLGLKRRGFSEEVIQELEDFYTTILRSGLNISAGIAKFQERGTLHAETLDCIRFIQNSKRGICR
ncbi:MAG: acyl-ACP--UDP-N-acetylglucosamine O-acyltransferase [Candidatus Kapaibacteriota bacterium]|jgi:UDP-N-acetylglucosamine acyltransferase